MFSFIIQIIHQFRKCARLDCMVTSVVVRGWVGDREWLGDWDGYGVCVAELLGDVRCISLLVFIF